MMVNKDNDMFEGKVAKIDSLQNIEQTTISEKVILPPKKYNHWYQSQFTCQ